jgi:VIT1/CCC1 family predicted Fe2+/Mn2+ transporter
MDISSTLGFILGYLIGVAIPCALFYIIQEEGKN